VKHGAGLEGAFRTRTVQKFDSADAGEAGAVPREVDALEVFRFAWFAVRTSFGVIVLVLALDAALWTFVKIHSVLMSNAHSGATFKRVISYSTPGNSRQNQEGSAVTLRRPSSSESDSCVQLHSTVACARQSH